MKQSSYYGKRYFDLIHTVPCPFSRSGHCPHQKHVTLNMTHFNLSFFLFRAIATESCVVILSSLQIIAPSAPPGPLSSKPASIAVISAPVAPPGDDNRKAVSRFGSAGSLPLTKHWLKRSQTSFTKRIIAYSSTSWRPRLSRKGRPRRERSRVLHAHSLHLHRRDDLHDMFVY